MGSPMLVARFIGSAFARIAERRLVSASTTWPKIIMLNDLFRIAGHQRTHKLIFDTPQGILYNHGVW